MRSGAKDQRYSLITVFSVCFSLSSCVFPVPLCAAVEIVAWGYNGYGQCTVPSPNTGFTAIAAAYYHSLGLKTDGSIVAWGNIGPVPSPNTDFTAIAAGGYHSLGLKTDGSIVAWGDIGPVPSPNTDFTAIAAGYSHSLGLKTDGSIVA
jgi:alpha-tubulin suppressor-like RCC1 family protein